MSDLMELLKKVEAVIDDPSQKVEIKKLNQDIRVIEEEADRLREEADQLLKTLQERLNK